MNKLFWSLLLSVMGNVIAWFHMNGHFLNDKYHWITKSNWWVLLGGIPISFLNILDIIGQSDQLGLDLQLLHLQYSHGHC